MSQDYSDLLDLPVADEAPRKKEDYSDILELPQHDAPSNAESQRATLRAAFGDQQLSTGSGPVSESLGRKVAEDRLPGFATQAKAGLAADPEQRRRIFAAQLFPGMPLNEALSRITYGDGGRLIAVDQNNNPFYIEPPAVTGPPSIVPGIPTVSATNLARNIVPGAGAAIPMAGGALASMAAGPGSLVAGPGLAAGGAAIGDAARQWAASAFDPGQQPYDYAQTLREGGLAAGGQFLGGAINRAMFPNRLMVPASDIRLAQTGNVLPQAAAAYDRAAAQGVQLTPGQASGLPSLLGYEDAAKINPAFADMAGRFYQQQGMQLQNAGNRLMDAIFPAADKTDAALLFQQGAEDAKRIVRQQANAAARPAYQAAEGAGQVMSPDLAQLADVPAVRSAIDAARADYANLYRRAAPETPDFNLWNLAKQKLDDMHGVASKAGERTTAMAIDGLRKDLLTQLDAAYPSYAQARAMSAPGQQLAARLEETATGKIANQTGDERVSSIVNPMFKNSNPAAISAARDAFTQAGQQDAWNAGVRAYVQDAIDKASRSQEGLNPAMLRRNVWGDKDVRANLQAAMTPDQFRGFDNFLSTVEDMAKTYPINSLTAMRQEASRGMVDAASNTPANKLVRGIGMAGSPQTIMRGLSVVTDAADKAITQRNLRNVVGNLFSPNGMAMLEGMANVTPGSNRARALALQLLSRGAPDLPPSASDAIGLPAPQPVNRLLAPQR